MAEIREGTKLTALCVEAKKRDMSYGNLVASTTVSEREKIIEEYVKWKRAEEAERKRKFQERKRAQEAERKRKKKK